MSTPFLLLLKRCGLSQHEAADYLNVRLDTVKSWSTGRNTAKPEILAELRKLYRLICKKAEGLRGLPCIGAYSAALGMAIAAMPDKPTKTNVVTRKTNG